MSVSFCNTIFPLHFHSHLRRAEVSVSFCNTIFPLHFHSHLRLTLPPPGSPSLHLRRTTNTFHAQKRGCGVTLERHREDKHGPCARLTRTNREGIPNVFFARRSVCIFLFSRHLPLSLASATCVLLSLPPGSPSLHLCRAANTFHARAKRGCGALCTQQRSLHIILVHCPTTASNAQSCLLCCQPQPFPRSLATRSPQFTLW